ncbi:MAG TPA: aminofutalosine synthase MqnE [Phycisphaerae bacterium]|nr:aminofutalosine synthase MqnE [Phycisphaerae bacterium]
MKASANPSPDINRIADRVRAGERLSFDEGLALYTDCDVHLLGELANHVREQKNGRKAYYNINRHINYSNYCVLRCKFCSFYRPWTKDGADDGYALSVEEVAQRAKQAADFGATEVHIVGGLHPKLEFDYYLDMCRAIKSAAPDIHVKAFTAIEIIHFTRITNPKLSIEEVLTQLRDAGLGSLPGGGAEIFDDRVHDEAYKNKVGEAGWFEVHRAAHSIGMYSNATMLYGHIETPAERIKHLIKLREHQDESIASRPARFNAIIPLPFIPDNSELAHLPGPSGLTNLRTLAIARLMLDNFDHVKAFWIMQTPKLAQVSLNWGVDDLDGTVVYYDITKREGTGTHQELTIDKIQRMIAEANCVPVERDTLYKEIHRDAPPPRPKQDDALLPILPA